MSDAVRATAHAAHALGLCPLPVRADGSKAPYLGRWTEFQKRRPNVTEMAAWFGDHSGVGLVCGAVSGGLEMAELEGRAVTEGAIESLHELSEAAGLEPLLTRIEVGYSEQTPSGGLHLLYFVDGPAKRNAKLASRPATADELAANPDEKVKVLAETRAEGGFTIIAPSNGTVHPSGGAWRMLSGALDRIATITAAERDALHDLLRSFDQMPTYVAPPPKVSGGDRPGDRYNDAPDVQARTLELLLARRWAEVYRRDGTIYLRRPGKQQGISATLGYVGPGVLHVFSTSTVFEAKAYAPFSVLAVLEHGGDFTAAAKALNNLPPAEKQPVSVLRFYTAREIATMTGDEPEWILRGWVARQAITEFDGKVKRAGKTTLVLHLVAAVLDGLPFLGYASTQTRVVVLTEQQPGPFREALKSAGLLDRGDELLILFRRGLVGLAWHEVVAQAVKQCQTSGAGLLVIDTIAKLAGIANENDAGEWAAAMGPLQDAAHDGLAVVVCRHDRKSSGDVGESGRGSSQASGDVDVIVQLRRPEGNQPTNRRVLETLSRYQLTPEKIVIELRDDEGYVLLGQEEAVSAADADRFCFMSLREMFDREESAGLTRDQLTAQSQDSNPVVSEPSIRRALDRLLKAGSVERIGAGKKGDPYRYRMVSVP